MYICRKFEACSFYTIFFLIREKTNKNFECTTSSENGDHLLIKVAETCIQC